MISFFESIRNYFDQKYHGRYLAIILRELAAHEPDSFALIIQRIAREPIWKEGTRDAWNKLANEIAIRVIVPTCEFALPGNRDGSTERRRADLAFVESKTPKLLIEIKEFDNRNPRNAAQLDDYLRHCKGTPFMYLSRFRPEKEELRKIELKQNLAGMALYLSYEQLHDALKGAHRPVATLVCRYLEDNGVGVYTEIKWQARNEQKNFKFLLTQMLGFKHASGLGRTQTHAGVLETTKIITILLGNVEVIGEWVRSANESIIPSRFNRRFFTKPIYNYQQLSASLNEECEERNSGEVGITDVLPYGAAKGGWVEFVATGSFKFPKTRNANDWLRIDLGIGLSIELPNGHPSQNTRVKPYVFSTFRNAQISDHSCRYEWLRGNASKEQVQEAFRSVMKLSVADAKKLARGTPARRAIGKFRVPAAT